MTDCKTGSEHIKSLKDGRTVYIDGNLVPDVTEHPAFRNSVKSAALLYDYQARPENIELMTYLPEGSNRRINRAWQMPRNYDEMIKRRRDEGCIAVEMEAAAFFAVVRFRKVGFGQILYAGDDVGGSRWNARGWTRRFEVREELFWLAVDACRGLNAGS